MSAKNITKPKRGTEKRGTKNGKETNIAKGSKELSNDETTTAKVEKLQNTGPDNSRDEAVIEEAYLSGNAKSEHSETDETADVEEPEQTTKLDVITDMSRRPLHPNPEMKSPTLSPKSSPGRRTRSNQKSPPVKHYLEDEELSEDENDPDHNGEPEDELDNENNSGRRGKPGKDRVQKIYPALPQENEVRERKKDGPPQKEIYSKGDLNKSKKELYEDEPDGKKRKEESSFSIVLVVLVCLIVIACFFGYNMLSSQDSKVSKSVQFGSYELFKKDFNKLKSEFPDQSSRFWKVISSQIRRILTEESPTYPAIILLGVPHSQCDLGACFTKKIVRMINRVMNASGDFYIDTQDLDGSSADQTKLELDERMHAALRSSKSVVLDHIETLPGKAALLLHGYCDGDNAPYKNAVIFLNLHPPKTFPATESMQDAFVEDTLVNLWQADLGQDEMPALQARIANNIAVMKIEKGNVCS